MDDGLWRQNPRASWKAIPIVSRTLVPSWTTSMPITFAVPDVGLRMVQRIMRRVVFPEPLGPRITIISPSSTVKFSSLRASVFPYLFERLRVSTAYKIQSDDLVPRDKNVGVVDSGHQAGPFNFRILAKHRNPLCREFERLDPVSQDFYTMPRAT